MFTTSQKIKLLVVMLTAGFGVASYAFGASPVLYFESDKTELTINQEATVNVMMDTKDMTVSAVELHMVFPKDLLEVKSIKAGNYLPVELQKAKVNASDLSLTLGSSPTDPKKGKGTLATLVVKALKSGKAELAFASNTRIAAIGQAQSVVSTMKPLILGIGTSGDENIKANNDQNEAVASDDQNNQQAEQPKEETRPGFWKRMWLGIKSFFSGLFH
jgi:hypothetical protein